MAAVMALGACGEADDPPAARGAELFQNHCALCHGTDREGAPTGPPLVHELYAPELLSDEEFRVAIQQGTPEEHWQFGDMPATALSDTEADAVTAYVRELQRDVGLID